MTERPLTDEQYARLCGADAAVRWALLVNGRLTRETFGSWLDRLTPITLPTNSERSSTVADDLIEVTLKLPEDVLVAIRELADIAGVPVEHAIRVVLAMSIQRAGFTTDRAPVEGEEQGND